ncbi:MAG: protein phosphatase 2C domain-containing protein [Candidatus Methanomethylophilaceae archaeon]|nr:protein phosphatase 2C domain-containing protein [Candidatus Methanomethylophilaceae archaeon]
MTGGERITIAYSTSLRGASHESKGTPCQDSSGSFQGRDYTLVVVSDGHGGNRHFRSDVGSRLAVEATRVVVDRCMSDHGFRAAITSSPEETMFRLTNAVITEWVAMVEAYDSSERLTESELEHITGNNITEGDTIKRYGATLLAGVLSDDIVFGFQIGDGEFMVMTEPDGCWGVMPVDDDCFLNNTTSICGSDASGRFRHFTMFQSGVIHAGSPTFRHYDADPLKVGSIIVCTDGLSTSFNSYESLCRYCEAAMEAIRSDEGRQSLGENLAIRSRSNMEDDVSLSMAVRDLPAGGRSISCDRCRWFKISRRAHAKRKKRRQIARKKKTKNRRG